LLAFCILAALSCGLIVFDITFFFKLLLFICFYKLFPLPFPEGFPVLLGQFGFGAGCLEDPAFGVDAGLGVGLD